MDIDPTQPWGVAIDYAGRATLTEAGHTVYINVTDTSLSSIITPDPLTGRHASVSVTAQFTETGTNGAVLRGYGRIGVEPVGTDPVVPDPTAVPRAVAAAVADFRSNTEAYVNLCARWTPDGEPEPDPDGGTDPAA
ncbi:ATP-binding protein [Streptomyces sp. NPDC048751]|uniref:ATP-binding protein n=1 Tax=Streptomyces sp. NPDC048751 TaxID=3365591 RepID=UPI0037216856